MNPVPLPRESWTTRRWFGFVLIIFAVQFGVLFLSGKHIRTPKAKIIPAAPVLIAAQRPAEIAELEDPTLFALPNQHGFSGAAWLDFSYVRHESADWTEPPRWLALRPDELGVAFKQLIRPNPVLPQIAQKIAPEIILPRLPAPDAELSSRSTFRIEGALASRTLLSDFDLAPQPSAGLLTNSIVQIVVNPAGFTRTATLLTSSGSKEADDRALALGKSARFEPLLLSQTKDNNELVWGKIIFEWATVSSSTNSF